MPLRRAENRRLQLPLRLPAFVRWKKIPDRNRAPLPPPPESDWSDADVPAASYFYEQAKGKRVTPAFRVGAGC